MVKGYRQVLGKSVMRHTKARGGMGGTSRLLLPEQLLEPHRHFSNLRSNPDLNISLLDSSPTGDLVCHLLVTLS